LPSSSLAGSQQVEAHREREALRPPGAEQVRQEPVQVCWLQEVAFQAWLAQQAQREREASRPPEAEQVRQEPVQACRLQELAFQAWAAQQVQRAGPEPVRRCQEAALWASLAALPAASDLLQSTGSWPPVFAWSSVPRAQCLRPAARRLSNRQRNRG